MNQIQNNKIDLSCYDRLLRHIEQKLGATFSKIRERQLSGIIENISIAAGFDSVDEYADWLLSNTDIDHISEFAKHLTIGETYFFRHAKTFDLLKTRIIPDILSSSNYTHKKLNIWCAGCSCGQEPYTLAMVLNEIRAANNEIDANIWASDINETFLDVAQKGIYTDWSFRETPDYYRNRYFKQTSEGYYKLSDDITKKVSFSTANLLAEKYPYNHGLDIIFCRNVLIYFNQQQIDHIVSKFLSSLIPGGWLITAPSEVPLISPKEFELVHCDNLFFFRKVMPGYEPKEQSKTNQAEPVLINKRPLTRRIHDFERALESKKVAQVAPHNATQPAKPEASSNAKLDDALKYFRCGKHSLAEKIIAQLDISSISATQAAELAIAMADCGQFSDASKWIDIALKNDDINAFVLYCKALILNATGQHKAAITTFEQVLFLDPEYVAAYFSLGTLLLKDNSRAAMKKLSIALELLEKFDDHQIIPGTKELTKADLKVIIESTHVMEIN